MKKNFALLSLYLLVYRLYFVAKITAGTLTLEMQSWGETIRAEQVSGHPVEEIQKAQGIAG
ncbi:MAG: hypothetical protein ACTTH7_02555 [Treponema sp.]